MRRRPERGRRQHPGSVDGTTVDDVELIPGESTTTIPRTPEPAVSVPAAIPTELLVTDLDAGTGYAAAVGDTLLVDYVGVRTVDGVEFDSSYERGIPYAFPLGQGRVIAGWDQGLVGIQVGTQRQLDVPPDLAYGDSPPGGSVIQPGDALTFVIEARAVVPAPDPIAAPTDIAFEPSVGATDLAVVDLVVGTGPPIAAGQTAVVHMLFVRGDDSGDPVRHLGERRPVAVPARRRRFGTGSGHRARGDARRWPPDDHDAARPGVRPRRRPTARTAGQHRPDRRRRAVRVLLTPAPNPGLCHRCRRSSPMSVTQTAVNRRAGRGRGRAPAPSGSALRRR